jgi:GGDEF domain-containing protein
MIEITLPTAITRDPELLHATLRKLGTTVRRTVRLGDDVGRLADGRFALVLPYTSKHGALACANRVQSVVQRTVEGAQVAIEVLGVAEDQQALATLCGPVANDTADPGTHAAAA